MLKLKLDMLYRGLSMEEARVKFAELSGTPVPPPIVEIPKRRRRIVALEKPTK